jgi:YHS domain-containing protein
MRSTIETRLLSLVRALPVTLTALLLVSVFTACQKEPPSARPETAGATEVAPGKVADPVCGMEVDPATAAAQATYAGKTYYFCTKEEKAQFEKEPEKYVGKGS